MKYVDQNDIKELIRERLEEPEKFIGKPLIIGRSMLSDGIQEFLLHEFFFHDYNQGRSDASRRFYKHLREGVKPNKYTGIYVMDATVETLNLPDNTALVKQSGLPVVIYLCDKCHDGEIASPYDESTFCIFRPDFEQWARGWGSTLIPDFIRAAGSEAETAYRWYNHFNRPEGELQGCDFPRVWTDAKRNLSLIMRARHVDRLAMLTLADFRAAFRADITSDVVDDFHRYVLATQ